MRFILLISICLYSISAAAQRSCVDIFDRGSRPAAVMMDARFVGENGGVFINTASGIFGKTKAQRVFFKTTYLNSDQLKSSVATIAATGYLESQFPEALDFIFVVTESNELRVHPKVVESSLSRVKHSSLNNGEPVLMAGELELSADGRIFRVNNRSGHYRPPKANLEWFIRTYFGSPTPSDLRVFDASESRR
ncbi:MAG: hypothetical protein EOP06_08305 [Proteobacteria bacterium]|nr:MAG: hypothetical protein EOP06_08305 [Pseudomonadota bacterium]